jgi:hypothetical protein
MYERQRNPFNEAGKGVIAGGVAQGALSNQTFSGWCWMGDFAQISVQVYNNSVVTMYGTNADLWKNSATTVNDASVVTAIAAAGAYKVEPGMGWVQFQRSTSTQSVFYVGQSRR